MVSKEVKKQVIEDWQIAFPQLTLFGQNKLYKVLGPLVIGLELIKLPFTDEYRPHFVCYPLWEKDIKSCLNNPFILNKFYKQNPNPTKQQLLNQATSIDIKFGTQFTPPIK